jgi:hypothetical protein
MAIVIKPKRSETASSIPTTSDLEVGEFAINTADKKLYVRDSSDNIKAIGGGLAVNDGSTTADVSTISFLDTTFGNFTVDTTSSAGTAIVRCTQAADLDYGLITDSVLGYNSVDYGGLT